VNNLNLLEKGKKSSFLTLVRKQRGWGRVGWGQSTNEAGNPNAKPGGGKKRKGLRLIGKSRAPGDPQENVQASRKRGGNRTKQYSTKIS